MNKRKIRAADTPMPTAAELLAATDDPGRGREHTRPPGGIASLGAALGVTEAPDARALREAADAEPGVRSRSCLIHRDSDGGRAMVVVSVAVAYGLALREVAERVRKRVTKAAAKLLGVRQKDVTVDVKIVWIDEPGAET
ncbi:MAG: Asp23/Gls24 family envelope stress response protein [Streptomycetaceae bacterium]|nr:Asp23/Gls24 family envelope stress response protein [Streptomycetaceae bacterium]